MNMRSIVNEYVKSNLLSVKRDEYGHEVVCYTKECFFGKDTWDDVTKSHRGAIYYNGEQVNKPFYKIFNIGEVEETNIDRVIDLMCNERYDIYDKSNGHLFIVSLFVDDEGNQRTVFSTKGSLPNPDNDLLNKDIDLFTAQYGRNLESVKKHFPIATMMFEAIVEHDKHTMYELQSKWYGPNSFVLLGANIFVDDEWNDIDYKDLTNLAKFVGCPVIKKYDEVFKGDPSQWVNHTGGIEGYVIKFQSGFRVKVKTKEYWLARFKKDLAPEVIVSIYRAGGEHRLRQRLPEEILEPIVKLIREQHVEWFLEHHVNVQAIPASAFKYAFKDSLTTEERKELFLCDYITQEQKMFIAKMADKKSPTDNIFASKDLRHRFHEFVVNSFDERESMFEEMKDIVDKNL